ncbi:nitrilase-related carbon-nitrogen hydrolase [Spirosoma soli]|uniref:Nitrilase-related carbon-nitrogen hydrolase n=1 Tax=Spirosoma soli TaxID=1770529 RepID=A0ABW5M780_9BACT
MYHKQHALAFAETMPWPISLYQKSLFGDRAMLTGEDPYLFRFTDRRNEECRMAIGICYEQMYPTTIARLTAQGAQVLTFMMNDGWFFDSPGAVQLLQFSRLRAIENRRSIARCSNQGFSGYIDPFGRIVELLPRRQAATATFSIRCNNRLSFYTRHPDWFPLGCVLLFVVLTTWFWLRLRKAREVRQWP